MIQKLKISIFDLAHPVDAAAVLQQHLHKQLGDTYITNLSNLETSM